MLHVVNGTAPSTPSGQLPRLLPGREQFVGIKISKLGEQSYQAKFTISKEYLKRIGNPKKVAIRGTPEDGYIITAGNDIKPSVAGGQSSAYIMTTVDRTNMPRNERGVVWMRAEIEKNNSRIRIPPLPPAWIAGDPEFMPGSVHEEGPRIMHVSKTPGDDALRESPSNTKQINDIAGNGISPVPKKTVGYQLPEGTSIDEAQRLLGQKLAEARAIIAELQQRTGMRFTLSRNLQLVVDLSAGG